MILDRGLEPGEEVVSTGARYLSQTFDDIDTTHSRPTANLAQENLLEKAP